MTSWPPIVPCTTERPVPGPGEVLLRNRAIGLNYADIYRRRGNYHLVGEPPFIAAGETVLIHAASGGVGCLLVQMAKARGTVVIGLTSSPAKAEAITSTGADLWSYLITPEARRERAARLFAALEAGELVQRIARTFPLADGAAAHRFLAEGGAAGKVLLIP